MSLKKLGRYDLIRVLGKGAMGLVYEGRDPNLDRRVAIKTIKVENLSDEAAAEYEVRFRTEARSAARLQHPNIVSVYDSDRDGDIAFLVMEFVEGQDLKHHLDHGQAYTLEQTLSIMGDLLSALAYAHTQKIVHRDIKPANLLVQASGRIKLADFGVARIQDSGDATRTQGTIVGTLKYMSPEQLEGKPIDARADLFAAGVVLYQLLTGARPFDGDTDFAVIQKIVNHTPMLATSFNSKLPPAIDAVVAKALAKSRDMRYGAAQDFAAALQAACQQAPDTTIAPVRHAPVKGSNSTWTATMMAGESLLATSSGVSTGTGASLVTQEVELVYWKDIKDSTDVEDLQGFLLKFPSGIYADLARRRLKNLGAPVGNDADSSSLNLAVSATNMDKTLVVPRPTQAEDTIAAIAVAAESSPLPQAASALAVASQAAPGTRAPVQQAAQAEHKTRAKTVWIAAGVAVLAVAGVAGKLLSSSSPAAPVTQVAGPPMAASAPSVVASASLPAASVATTVSTQATPPAQVTTPLLVSAPASAPAALALRPAAVSAVTAAAGSITPSKPATAASKAAAIAAKKPTPEKDKPAKEGAAKTPSAGGPAADKPAAPAPATSPRAACEDRVLFGFQSCMAEQCAKPTFAQHPICIERRGMEERRREAERNR